ncbi:hypothetical protein EPIB1_1180 [Tritonibacter mobilis]|uniref:hypothetical protein n=1 Tax=Tritonibacter mobilis TaxID=379347 RepID=UPI000F71FC36|nr:hypothetical protein [Tritonibacter mobilis]VCU58282.1 hypothetical protein EPIB1_1180 [Tritonibacter mobilis]
MTEKRIIYQNDDESGICVIIPWLGSGLTVEEIAAKDVPFGRPFKIVDAAEVPIDRSSRDLWTVDEADLTDGVGADYGVGSKKPFVMPEPPEDEAVEEDPVPPGEEPVT